MYVVRLLVSSASDEIEDKIKVCLVASLETQITVDFVTPRRDEMGVLWHKTGYAVTVRNLIKCKLDIKRRLTSFGSRLK